LSDTTKRRTPTPAATIEAVLFTLRHGFAGMADPANRARLRRCDGDAMKEIASRLLNHRALSLGLYADWTTDDVTRLVAGWRKIGGRP
jgi:hypothetical protein